MLLTLQYQNFILWAPTAQLRHFCRGENAVVDYRMYVG